MATSSCQLLLLLLLLGQAGAGVAEEAVVCAGKACYTAHWGKLSAAEAQRNCSANGGNLATVKSEEEARHIQDSLTQLLKPQVSSEATMGKFWIGLQREKGKCWDPNLPLKGFSWVGGGEHTPYTNWQKEGKSTCISRRCVALLFNKALSLLPDSLPKWSEGPCGTPGNPVSNVEGFVCKFSFKGMCRPLALGGPGQVTYTTPFLATSSSLGAVPFASSADVTCGDEGKEEAHYFLCKEKDSGVFDWDSSGPLCTSSKLGCSFNNGGCQQDCFDGGDGSFRCGCRPGFRLLDDLVTCASRSPCSSDPCRGMAMCVPEPQWQGYTCHCPPGYQLDPSQLDCEDIDECLGSPCPQECINTPGGFSCECWVGYEPGGPGEGEESCLDVDECAPGLSPCAQGCTNTQGSFHCSCPSGSQLASDGVSCTFGYTSLGPPTGSLPGEAEGGGEGSTIPSTMTPNPTRAPEYTSDTAPVTRRPSLLSDTSVTHAPTQTLVPSGTPGLRLEPSTRRPTTTAGRGASAAGASINDDSVAQQSDGSTDGQKLLLFYILGTVVAILLMLALALGLLVYRKRKAKKEEKEKKPQSAADSYSWVPERAESRAMENQYSPAPGTDC
ncbi:complement component C1q receptor [Tamandua tetradactyla]|uniref:complement component C1q receptor n=1 Tax=Tamandua tetradactyla TaxID=48850 RepID=UPI004053FC4D